MVNNLKLNATKTKEFNISTSLVPHPLPALATSDETLEVVHTIKLLGVHLCADLKWSEHINNVYSKASKRLFAPRILKWNGAVQKDLRNVYTVVSYGLFSGMHAPYACVSEKPNQTNSTAISKDYLSWLIIHGWFKRTSKTH